MRGVGRLGISHKKSVFRIGEDALYKYIIMCTESNALLYVPHKGAETEERIVNIEFVKTLEEWLNLSVLHHSEDCAVH